MKINFAKPVVDSAVPNTQYSLYSTALIIRNKTKIESTPSETLIAWTDPAFPAFVEVGLPDKF